MFRFSVSTVPLGKGFLCVSPLLKRGGRFRLLCWLLQAVPTVPVPMSFPGTAVPT